MGVTATTTTSLSTESQQSPTSFRCQIRKRAYALNCSGSIQKTPPTSLYIALNRAAAIANLSLDVAINVDATTAPCYVWHRGCTFFNSTIVIITDGAPQPLRQPLQLRNCPLSTVVFQHCTISTIAPLGHGIVHRVKPTARYIVLPGSFSNVSLG